MTKEEIEKYISGNTSQEERERFQLWVEANEGNKKEFAARRMLYDIFLLSNPDKQDSYSIDNRKQKRSVFYRFIEIAAIIAITIGCTYYFLESQKPEIIEETKMLHLHVPPGQRAELTLTDGTKVWLNAQSTLIFPDRFSENSRDIYLDGEGYFDVSTDKDKVFKVNTGNHVINVLGTEFNVSSYSKKGNFDISLLEGSVEIVDKLSNQNTTIQPGQRAYVFNNKLLVDNIKNYDHFLWTQGIVSFDHERVDNIIDLLSLYYDIEIINENKTINSMRYTGKFRTKDGIEHVLNVLKIPTRLKYDKDNDLNQIRIY